ncbi:hypothetical protein EH243_10945 [Amphritea opalescens]|uniref:Uncharacterized protein n=1 Tax=Amphritea opalescens TaxID=2490544 RepID=A0A430KR03_9GAMM|nr:hypothetical protein [Amphritea opalescens]RTE65774.1 hypothetical protein EH243_10945 [Amphritea opalescens]
MTSTKKIFLIAAFGLLPVSQLFADTVCRQVGSAVNCAMVADCGAVSLSGGDSCFVHAAEIPDAATFLKGEHALNLVSEMTKPVAQKSIVGNAPKRAVVGSAPASKAVQD